MFKGRNTENDEPPPQQPAAAAAASPASPTTSASSAADPIDTPSQSSFGFSSQSTMGQEPEVVESHEEERPTDSHHLADMAVKEKPVEEKGHAEVEHGEIEVKNLGWNTQADKVSQPMVGGLTNEELWILVRRFDKVGRPGQGFGATLKSVVPLRVVVC